MQTDSVFMMKTLAQNLRFCKGQIPKELAEFFEPAGCGKCYTCNMVEVFREVKRVLHDSGTVWLNVGDSYAGSSMTGGTNSFQPAAPMFKAAAKPIPDGLKPKNLCLIPWRLAIALQADGWWVRSVIAWAKKSCMPESVTDRPTNSWEPIFLLAKSASYYFDAEAVKEPSESEGRIPGGNKKIDASRGDAARDMTIPVAATRNQRNVWHLGPEPYAEAHFATFPTEIPKRAILAGTSAKGCCPECSEPWVRVVERKPIGVRRDDGGTDGYVDFGMRSGRAGEAETRTLGWQPGCECNAGKPVACKVLDPFVGSGTTVQVAQDLGRIGVGLELNREYIALARKRTAQQGLML